MRLISAALALLFLGVACAVPKDRLSFPKFEENKSYHYDVWLNITAGVPGMNSQVSKSALNAELHIYAHSPTVLIIRMHQVRVSGSLHGVGSATDPIKMRTDSALEKELSIPIKATYEKGLVKSYTLASTETLESKKIKRTILRALELHLEEKALQAPHEYNMPKYFNTSTNTPYGNYSTQYILTSSPYPHFPYVRNVYNISRTDNYETIPYLAYHSHHNFVRQGCPGTYRRDQMENPTKCSGGYEPYQTPIKKSFVQHHSLRAHNSGISVIDIIFTKETHVADVYDQNMEISIESMIRLKKTEKETINEPTDQETYDRLEVDEVNEAEINHICKHPGPKEALTAVKNLLNKITHTVLERNIETDNAKSIGEHLVMLQKSLTLLHKDDLKDIQNTITDWASLREAKEEDKIKRQIWLDLLPLIGTKESVSFIAELIKENVNKAEKAISLWDAKNLLEALPMNIMNPTTEIVQTLIDLTGILHEREVKGYAMYFAASHLAVARVLHSLCSTNERFPDENRGSKNLNSLFQNREEKCPKQVVKKLITDLATKLKTTTDRTERMIYIETLSHVGQKSVLPILKSYVNGHIKGLSPSSNDFVRSVTIHSLHNLVTEFPEEVRKIVFPVYINRTEAPKLRNAAFGVFIRSYPSLGELHLVAAETWRENSLEVGSYVTNALETFGNSSDLCDQTTVLRIKKIMPQVKRFHVGQQHSQYVYDTLLDGIRNFGLEHRYEVVPSNESFWPSAIYTAFGFNKGSLKDYFYKIAMNAQGFSSRNIHDALLEFFKSKTSDDIPKVKIPEIFPEVDIASRDTEFWRFTFFQKLFYINSFYSYDSKEHQMGNIFELMKEHFLRQFTDVSGRISGHIVQVYIPSSYQTKAVGHAIPYTVQFEMKNPILVSLKFDIKHAPDQENYGVSIDVSPSVYYSTMYTNQMLNLGDCKNIGVHHEKKAAFTYPVKVTLSVKNGNPAISYEFPELNKKIFTYSSEARTYAGKLGSEELPFMKEKTTIKTIPTQFVKEDTFGVPGLPLFRSKILTEDIQFGKVQTPQSRHGVISLVVQDFLNAGWRRKSVDITRIPNQHFWIPETKVELHLDYARAFKVSKEEPETEEEWAKKVDFEVGVTNYKKYGKAIVERISTLSHIEHKLALTTIYKLSKKFNYTSTFHVVHKHTFGGAFHSVSLSALFPKLLAKTTVHGHLVAAFIRRPNEFKYDEHYEKQQAMLIGALSLNNGVFENPYVIFGAYGRYRSLEDKLNKEVNPPAPKSSFLPETHEECIRDVKDGKPQSVHCLKAINDRAIYNKWDAGLFWTDDLPEYVTDMGYQTDLFLKMALFSHMTYKRKHNPHTKNGVIVDITYIDKLTDRPVVDMILAKPTEEVRFEKVDAGLNQPISSIYSIQDRFLNHWTNNTYPPTCSLMHQYVRTYDMKTFHAPVEKGCSYILTTHCLEHKKFAIIAKIHDSHPEEKDIHIHVGKHTILLTPPQKRKYVIKFDDEERDVNILRPVIFSEEEHIYAVNNIASDGSFFVEIHAELAGIIVTYDGKNVKTQVDIRYKGELCGLCSEFNGEVYRELRGPKKCLYTDSRDFTKSNVVGKCGDTKPKHPHICPHEESHEWSQEHTRKEQEPTLRRNRVIYEENRICFSIDPVPSCEGENREVRTSSKSVEFHCLPKTDTVARKLVIESKRRSLPELKTKTVDKISEVTYALSCSS